MTVYSNLPFSLVNGSVPPAHRGDIWFEDGTVILLSGCTAFKVYKGLLARDSRVFAALFNETPLDHLVKIRIEGCEVIRMDEPVSKLRPVLQWIHGGIGKHFPPFDDFQALTFLFTLADFYQLHNLPRTLIQPLLKHYLDRLRLYEHWDGLHSIPKPVNPIHALNFVRTYEVRILSLVPIIMVDLTVFVSEAELLGAREPRRSSPYAPGLNQSQDRDLCSEFWDHHKALAKAVGRIMTRFDAGRMFSRRVRCCSFKRLYEHLVEKLEKKASSTGRGGEWLTESHGRYGLELILESRTNPARALCCDACLNELDGEVMAEYQAWWEKIPKILGLEGGWHDEALRDLEYGDEEISWNLK